MKTYLVLADHFVAKASRKCGMRVKPVSPEALACLMHYDWPGNVRELENALERALVLGSTDSILPDDLPETVLEAGSAAPAATDKYHGSIKETKKQLMLQALQQANGNYIEAAKALGMHPNSLLRLIRNLDLKGVKAEMQAPEKGELAVGSLQLAISTTARVGTGLRPVPAERSRQASSKTPTAQTRNGALSSRAGSMTTAQTSASAPWTAIPTSRNGSSSIHTNG